MKRSETFSAIAPALVAALGKIEGAAKKKTNPAFKSSYANLEAVIDASRDILTEHGLTVVQMPGEVANGAMTLDTMIVHASGEWIEGSFQIPFGKVDPQGAGSAISYARRYALMAALNMPAVDDDGNAATLKAPANNSAPANGLGTEKRDTGPGSVDGKDWWGCSGPGLPPAAAKRDPKVCEAFEEAKAALENVLTPDEWKSVCAEFNAKISTMPRAWRTLLRADAERIGADVGVDFNERRAA